MADRGRGRRAALGATTALLAVALFGVGPRAGASSHSSGKARLLLEGQTEWVVPSSATTPAPFVLDLATRTARGAVVSTAVYARLVTRDDFENAVRNGPRGFPVARTAPTPASSLPADARAPGGFDLSLGVLPGSTTPTSQPTQIGLGCGALLPGTCTGVYPVEVTLSNASGDVLDRLTTFLIYQAAKSAHPLDLALVVRFGAPVAVTAHPSGTDALAPPSKKQTAALGRLLATLRNAGVPVTLDPSPETLVAMDGTRAGRAVVASFAAMSATQPSAQVLAAPFAPVNLGALASAGEPTEILAQASAGSTALRSLRVQVASSPSTWIVEGPAGKGLGAGLSQLGAAQVVLPGADLAAPTTTATNGTFASTFHLAERGSTTSVRAALADTYLSGQFAGVAGDPALAASQVLADLAMVHFERPNTPAVRGMVAVTPDAASSDDAFYRDLLSGLEHDPAGDVTPVTLTQYFSGVRGNGTRLLAPQGGAPKLGHSLAERISTARVRLTEFEAAVTGHPRALGQLGDDLLAAESSDLHAGRQGAAVASFEKTLAGQLRLVSFAAGTFTLTARTGVIPITVDSSATYHLKGTLTVSGNKFIFPHSDASSPMKLDHATNVRRVDVEVRSSGDLPLHAVFTSPDGRLVIAQRLLTVRSTATSVVGIVLSVAALCILLAWWARTWWSGRRRRKRLEPVAGA